MQQQIVTKIRKNGTILNFILPSAPVVMGAQKGRRMLSATASCVLFGVFPFRLPGSENYARVTDSETLAASEQAFGNTLQLEVLGLEHTEPHNGSVRASLVYENPMLGVGFSYTRLEAPFRVPPPKFYSLHLGSHRYCTPSSTLCPCKPLKTSFIPDHTNQVCQSNRQ